MAAKWTAFPWKGTLLSTRVREYLGTCLNQSLFSQFCLLMLQAQRLRTWAFFGFQNMYQSFLRFNKSLSWHFNRLQYIHVFSLIPLYFSLSSFPLFYRNLSGPGNNLHQDSFYNMQASQSSKSWSSHLDHRCARSLRSGGPSQSPPAPYRPCSIPIIPSVHSYQDEVSCMQTAPTAGTSRSSPLESTAEASAVDQQCNVMVSNRAAGRREDVASLLDEAQEQLRALAHAQRKPEDISSFVPQGAKETVCILLANGCGQGGVASFGPTETQLVSPRDMHKDATKPGQWEGVDWTNHKCPVCLGASEYSANIGIPLKAMVEFLRTCCGWKRGRVTVSNMWKDHLFICIYLRRNLEQETK